MMKKKKTLNQLEYEKALKNLKRRIKAAEKRGFRFDESEILPSEKPKRITKKRIESIKKLNIYYQKGTTYLNDDTGKVVSGIVGQAIERKARAKKAAQTRKARKEQKQQKFPIPVDTKEYTPTYSAIASVENKLDEINYDFKIDLEKVVLEKTFDILKENNLIKNINDLDAIPNKEKFVDILISGKLPEEKVFKLELDNIQTKYLYEKIKINSKSLTLGKFLKIFGNKNENAKSKTISSSKSNSKIETPKNIEILNQLF